MTYTKMILFDYGHTLLCEPDFEYLRGVEALLRQFQKFVYEYLEI